MIKFFEALIAEEDVSTWSAPHIIELINSRIDYNKPDEDICFSNYANEFINRIIASGKNRLALDYKRAIKSLHLCLGTNQVMFSQMTRDNINKWIKSLSGSILSKEMYSKIIRRIYIEAMREFNDYEHDIIRINAILGMK